MKKWNLIYLGLLLVVLNSCNKEEVEVDIKTNYAANPSKIDINGNYLTNDKIAFLWWAGNSENFCLFNTITDSLIPIGTVGDLYWWQQQCIVKEDTLYTFGYTQDDETQLILYKNELITGTSISKINMPNDLTNLTIAGRYNNNILLLWWNGSNESIGVFNTTTNNINTIGAVGDLYWWQQQCIIKDDTLYAFGYTETDVLQLILYKNDLQTGKLVSKTIISADITNLIVAGTYNEEIILLYWNNNMENIGILNTTTGSINIIGSVGDLKFWQGLCFINGNTLYTIGYNESDEISNILYKNDLQTGNLKSKTKCNSNLTNLTISKNK